MLYPLKFSPILKERIWGGEKLVKLYNKGAKSKAPYGESWELSAVPGDVSQVSNGNLKGSTLDELIHSYGAQLLGKRVYNQFGNTFPLLIKLIDAREDLSVQVHPNDHFAKQRHNCFGKNEMWYVVDADKGATLFLGFKHKVTKQEYIDCLNRGALTEILDAVEVKAGDAFYIPAGLVHAIGGGVVIAEIQQTSDITYRLFDWNRVDGNGKGRELHTDLAVDVIDYNGVNVENLALKSGENLATTPYFITNHLNVNGELNRDYSDKDSFVIFIVNKGSVKINGETAQKGDTLLIPASVKKVKIEGEADMLEVYL